MSEQEELVNDLLLEVDQQVCKRREQGAAKYGNTTFLDYDNLQQAMDEVVDLINYARFAYVKLRLLQLGLQREFQTNGSVAKATGPEMPGKHATPTGFITTDSDFGIWMQTERSG